MKAVMSINDHLGFELYVAPETVPERIMLEAIHKGTGVKVEVFAMESDGGYALRIKGEGQRTVNTIVAQSPPSTE